MAAWIRAATSKPPTQSAPLHVWGEAVFGRLSGRFANNLYEFDLWSRGRTLYY